MQISSLVSTLPSALAVSGGFNQEPEHGGAAEALQPAAVPTFITPASLISTSGGTAAVNVLWSVAKHLVPGAASSPWVPFGCSIFIGGIIYITALGDKNTSLSRNEKLSGVAIAFINSMVLFAAALGIQG